MRMTYGRIQAGAMPGHSSLAVGGILTATLLCVGGALLVTVYESVLPLLFPLLLTAPIVFFLSLERERGRAEIAIFARSIAVGMVAAGIASYYAYVQLDPYQLGSDAASFYELSSQSGPARTLQDLRTITEGAGAVVLWGWFYDLAAIVGFPREPYVGISINIVIVAVAAVISLRSARCLYGEDDYRFSRLILFFTIAGNMWLFAGLHLRDSSIFLIVVMLAHFWIAYLAELKHSKVVVAVMATLLSMPLLEVLRKEFFYIPLMVGFIALLCLNFSRGRGDTRFITLVSIFFGLALAGVGLVAFGEDVQRLLFTGQQTYSEAAIADARSGSLGTALIVEQPLLIRIGLGVPYLFYFPIPFWSGFSGEGAILLFKSINAVAFYFISAFLFAGGFLILSDKRLRSPAFLFVLLVPFAFSISVALTSLESRHLGVFMSLFFLIGLLPDLRETAERNLVRFSLILIVVVVALVHAAWFALRYA